MTEKEYREKLTELEMALMLEKDIEKKKVIKMQIKQLGNIRKTYILEEMKEGIENDKYKRR